MKFAKPDKFFCGCSSRTGIRIVAFLLVIATWFEFCFFFPEVDCRKLETDIIKVLEACKSISNLFKLILAHVLLLNTFMKERTQDSFLLWVRYNLFILFTEACLLFISMFIPGTSILMLRLIVSIGFYNLILLAVYSYYKKQKEHIPKLTVFDKNSSNNLDYDLDKDIDLERNKSYKFYFEPEEKIIDTEKNINNNCIFNPNEEIIIDFMQQISYNFDFDSKQEIIDSKKHTSYNSPNKEVINSEKHTLLYPLVLHPMLSLALYNDLSQPESDM